MNYKKQASSGSDLQARVTPGTDHMFPTITSGPEHPVLSIPTASGYDPNCNA